MRISTFFLFVSFLVVGCSWEAERDNPLDPESKNFSPGGELYGRISRLNGDSLVSAFVYLDPGFKGALSDENGDYSVSGLEMGEYNVTVELDGYKTEYDTVFIPAGGSLTQDYLLDALPVFDSFSVTSQHIYTQSPGNDIYKIKIQAVVSDLDDDLPNFAIAFWDTNIDTLLQGSAVSIYEKEIFDTYFPGGNIENILGLVFECSITDNNEGQTVSSPTQLVRIIDAPDFGSLNNYSPKNFDLVSTNPTFVWGTPTGINFSDYQYRLSIHKEINDEQMYEKVLADSVTVYELSDSSLPVDLENPYYWTIQLEDLFGNFCRSYKMKFFVDH